MAAVWPQVLQAAVAYLAMASGSTCSAWLFLLGSFGTLAISSSYLALLSLPL
jgi:hypothetical protein